LLLFNLYFEYQLVLEQPVALAVRGAGGVAVAVEERLGLPPRVATISSATRSSLGPTASTLSL
jgi:hypothetical protein